MLSKLFGSQARVKLLKLFLMNTEKRYYVRELSRILNLQINSVRRELDNLEKFGLLVFEISSDEEEVEEGEEVKEVKKTKGVKEKKFYRVNHGFPLYEEIKVLIVKSHVLYKHDFIDDIKKAGDVKVLILAGLFVNCKDAPIDLLIVGEVDRSKLMKLLKNYEKDLGKEVNFTCMSEREFRYRKSMTDVFLYDVLEGEHMLVVNSEGLL